jgi:hypothetical protein
LPRWVSITAGDPLYELEEVPGVWRELCLHELANKTKAERETQAEMIGMQSGPTQSSLR